MMRLIAVALTALTLSGCAILPGGDRSILIGGTSITAPVELIDDTTMAGIETAYGAALAAAVAYRRMPRCAPGTSATVQAPCSQRSVIVRLQGYARTATRAVHAARRINEAGGVNALDVLRIAREAVREFRAVLSVNGVTS